MTENEMALMLASVAVDVQDKDVDDILNKIRAEIIELPTISFNANDIYKADVLAIIDKYRTERE